MTVKPYKYEGHHKRPTSRRDFFAQGFYTLGTAALMPSLLSSLSQRAYAEPMCKAATGGGAARMVPFLVIDLAGGANIPGCNVIVGGLGGQTDYLPAGSYQTIGLAAEAEPSKLAPSTELGLAFHPRSQVLAGITATTAATTRAGVEGTVYATSSGDDSRNNPHSPLFWIANAGLNGQLVSLVGSRDAVAGGNSAAPAGSVDPSKRPSLISTVDDALGLVDPGKLVNLMTAAGIPQQIAAGDVNKILAATRTMSDARIAKFNEQDLPTQVKELITCGYINGADLLTGFTPAALDPRTDPAVIGNAGAGVPATFNVANAAELQAATITKLVLDGYAGAGVVTMGGYDYHGQGRATQNTKDLAVGRMIGSALEMAARKNTPLMIYVYTDGGVAAGGGAPDANGFIAFASDSGQRGSTYTLVYKPGGERPVIRDGRRQIGAFTGAGSVDTTAAKTSTNVEILSKAVAANYLALHGKEGELAKVVGDNPFGAELDKYLSFTKIV